ncbi:hypothetical protein C0585_01870 [Candidatus Woesearchaeota archaeon]|nr:MAG: hypothetical protein C0585_01870 [Candidatus Woesearchaeota archaeon]
MGKRVELIFILFIISFSIFSLAATDPNLDSDNDKIKDINDEFPFDYDNDGIPDSYEEEHGLDPKKDSTKIDTDSDSLYDVQEYELGCDPNNPDTDGDGYLDGNEVNIKMTSPTNKFSPFDIDKLMSLLIPLLIILLIILIAFYIIITKLKKEKEPNEEETPKKGFNINFSNLFKSSNKKQDKSSKEIDDIDEEKDKKTEKKAVEQDKKEGILKKLLKILELILGPDIKKAKAKRLAEEEKEKGQEEENDEVEEYDTGYENNDDSKEANPNSFLMRLLSKNKRKNKIQDVFEYFDKEIDEEELNFLKEKKTKQEVIDFLNKRKEMKKKIMEELKKQKTSEVKETVKTPTKPKPKEDTVFDKLEKISDENYEDKLK